MFLHDISNNLAQYFAASSELAYTTCIYGSLLFICPCEPFLWEGKLTFSFLSIYFLSLFICWKLFNYFVVTVYAHNYVHVYTYMCLNSTDTLLITDTEENDATNV